MMKNSQPKESDVCPKCEGTGYVVDEATNTTQRCDCETQTWDYRFRLQQSGIPKRFLKATFDTFETPRGDRLRAEVLEASRIYAESVSMEDPEGIVMRGQPGSGKTHLAVAILRRVMERGMDGLYIGFNELLTQIRHSYNPDFPLSEDEVLMPLYEADVLVLDDLGAETTKDFVRDRLYLIVNRRYEAEKPLIITTNCDTAELDVRVGPRISSRLSEMCSAPFPEFPNDDWRRRGSGAVKKPSSRGGDSRLDRMS